MSIIRSKTAIALVSALALAVTLFGLVQIMPGRGALAADSEQPIVREEQNGNVREGVARVGPASVDQPNIGFIDNPSATCYQPDPAQDACYINWYSLSVNADPSYVVTMTLTLNPKPIAHMQGFFQKSMYVPYSMFGQGFKVACGALGAGGTPTLGNAYAYTVRARDSANLSSANYGTVYCPAYIP